MQQRFLLQILLLVQHVSGTTMPIIGSSRVLYSGCCLWYFVLWFFKWLVWCRVEGYASGLQDAAASCKDYLMIVGSHCFTKSLQNPFKKLIYPNEAFNIQFCNLEYSSLFQSDIYQMLYWYNSFSWWWARGCSKHVENWNTRVATLIVSTIYLQLIQNRCMFRSFTVLQCSHQHCVQPVASDVEVVGYL